MAKFGALTGHFMAFTVIIIYSFNTNFMKVLIPEWIGPEGLVLLRCTASLLCFGLLDLFVSNGTSPRPEKKDILMMMLGGVLGMGGNLLLYLRGLSMTGPVDAFVIRTVQPIIVILFAVIFLHAVFTKYKAFGIFLGLAGTVYISIAPHFGSVHDSFRGDMIIFLSSVSYALFLILIKPYTYKFNAILVMKWMSLGAILLALPFGFRQLIEAPLFKGEAGIHIWLELGYTLLIATFIAYFLNLKALNYISPFIESVYIYLLPITGAAVSIAMGLQKFSWHDPIAFVLIVGGFIFINMKTKQEKMPSPQPADVPANKFPEGINT